MHGQSGSSLKGILTNPLVWIAWILTGFTLHYEGYENTFEIFLHPTVYQNLIIGVTIYVLLFNRQYKNKGSKLDIKETLSVILETMYFILFVWLLSLGLIVGYFSGGENYKAALAEKYRRNGWGNAKEDVSEEDKEELRDIIKNVEIEKGKSYRVTPKDDGSFVIEVIEE